MDVSVFYTFWGLTALKKQVVMQGKTLKEKMFAAMTPGSLRKMPISKMNFGGMGRAMLTGVDPAIAARAIEAIRAALTPYTDSDGVRLGAAVWQVTALA